MGISPWQTARKDCAKPGSRVQPEPGLLSKFINLEKCGPAAGLLKGLDTKLSGWAAEIQAPPPVFVFQMGKVGSCSLVETLTQAWPGRVVHAHALNGMNAEDQAQLRFRKRLRLPVLVVTPVRDPLSRNVSAFFQNFERDVGVPLAARSWTLDELRDLFLRNYPHERCLEWFDRQYRPVFGIDVYASAFPRKRGWQVYRRGSVRALVYRTDLEPERQLEVLSDFLALKLDRWVIANQAAAKPYAAVYSAFCSRVSLPADYRGLMSMSDFARHFWTAESIARFNARWSDSPRASAGEQVAPEEQPALSALGAPG